MKKTTRTLTEKEFDQLEKDDPRLGSFLRMGVVAGAGFAALRKLGITSPARAPDSVVGGGILRTAPINGVTGAPIAMTAEHPSSATALRKPAVTSAAPTAVPFERDPAVLHVLEVARKERARLERELAEKEMTPEESALRARMDAARKNAKAWDGKSPRVLSAPLPAGSSFEERIRNMGVDVWAAANAKRGIKPPPEAA